MILFSAPAPPLPAPRIEGDPAIQPALEEALRAAGRATEELGPWPPGAWTVRIHADPAAFERATGAPPGRGGQWVGATLHLRPWEQLRRRDLAGLLRHELAHRRLARAGLRRWEEEARCLWAEAHARLPVRWPAAPGAALQDRLDRALAGGTTREQAWAYRWLRAWVAGRPLPPLPPPRQGPGEAWQKSALLSEAQVTVIWPLERLKGSLEVNGQGLAHQPGRSWSFQGSVIFGEGFPVSRLEGRVAVEARPGGWRLVWRTSRSTWLAAAVDGELGAEAPLEAQRALASVLDRWLSGHRRQHPGGALCPLTHCAVVRGAPSWAALQAVAKAPALGLDSRWAFFTGSAGGLGLSPQAVWGRGPAQAGGAATVPGDRWAAWERTLTPSQVALLKRTVRPGLRPGQRGLWLGDSGPYAVEALRLAAGRSFGWTAWPGNACEAALRPDGSLHLAGRGWGHNVGLCLATARFRAAQGATAEQILDEAFPPSWHRP